MTRKVLVVFAMKEEFSPWRRRHRFKATPNSPLPVWTAQLGSTEVYVVLAGAGAPEAHAILNLTEQLKPSLAIVTGVAAGLKPDFRPGDLLVGETVRTPGSVEEIQSSEALADLAEQCGAWRVRTIVTVPHVVRTRPEKEALGKLGDAAEMESWPLMKRWTACGTPCVALRVILDPVEMPVTCDFESALDAHGQVRIIKIMAQLALQPGRLPDFLHLAGQSGRALKILTPFLDRFIERLDQDPAPDVGEHSV